MHSSYVITAAHCVDPTANGTQPDVLVAGDPTSSVELDSRTEQKLFVEQIWTHPKWYFNEKVCFVTFIQFRLMIGCSTLCSRNFQNVKLSSKIQELFVTQFCIKSILAKIEYQKLPFLQFQRLSTLNFGIFGT